MGRHTRPPVKAKHSRAHTREQRRRHIETRFARARAAGRLRHTTYWPELRRANREDYAEAMEETKRWLADEGLLVDEGESSIVRPPVGHPESLRSFPSHLRGRVRHPLRGASLSSLADRDLTLDRTYYCRCPICVPHTVLQGWRSRAKRTWEREVSLAQDELFDEEELQGDYRPPLRALRQGG